MSGETSHEIQRGISHETMALSALLSRWGTRCKQITILYNEDPQFKSRGEGEIWRTHLSEIGQVAPSVASRVSLKRRPPLAEIHQEFLKELINSGTEVSVPPQVAVHSAQVSDRQVLWAGPLEHPFVKELERTCRALYYPVSYTHLTLPTICSV